MEFQILGPVEAHDGGRRLAIGGPKQRALLAVLLLARTAPVTRDRLIEALWGERPPATVSHTLDAYLSRLRKLVGADRLTRSSGGYVLRVDPGELDLDVFEELTARGRDLLADGRSSEAADTLRSALALWRGEALADVVYEPFGDEAAAWLESRRLAAIEERIDAELACGRAGELVGELEELLRREPFRERLLAQLMLALYRSGQPARALETYRAARHRLADELGLDPGRSLQELERAMLTQDPALEPPARAHPVRRASRRRRWMNLGVAACVLAALTAGVVVQLQGPEKRRSLGSSAGVILLERNAAVQRAALSLESPPTAIALGYGSAWAAHPSDGIVERIDLARHTVADRIPVGGTPGVIAVGGGSVWTASVPGGSAVRIDPGTGTVTQRIPLGGSRLSALAFGRGSLWVTDATDESLLEIDPGSGALRRTLTLSVHPTALAVDNDAIWVADYDAATVSEVDILGGNILATTRVGTGPTALALSHGSLWVANALDSTVSRVDLHTGTVTATIPIASRPTSIIADGRWVWVAARYPGSVSRIDPRRAVVLSTTPVGGSPTSVAASGSQLWLGIQSLVEHRGGTITLVHTRPITLDPALQEDLLPLVSDGLTRDGLVTYNHVQGPAGTQLVPDLAVDIPVPTSGETIYRFRLRPGIRYSDGRLVRAADFRRAIERAFRLGAPASRAFAGVVGATACTRLRCDLSSGIVTDQAARTVSFRLRAPDPDLLSNLTQAAASPVPPGTPWHRTDTEPIPGTGPYAVVEANARRIVWTRNRFFREWSHAAQPAGNPDRIVMRFGLQPEQEVREIEAGRADAILDNIPARLVRSVRTRHASQMHSYVIPTTDFVQFNTTRPPFDDVRVRRALNLAIDRRAIVRLYGGSSLATPTCQVLPPGAIGYRRYCPYTRGVTAAGVWRGPDLARARRLVDASGTRGQAVTVWGWTDDPTISVDVIRYVANVLRGIGYRARVHLVKHAALEHPAPGVFRKIQLAPAAWGDATPYGFVAKWFGCRSSDAHGWFCDLRIDRMNAKARSLRSIDPRAAAALWSAIDRDLVDRAAWLPMVNERGLDYLSERVTNYQSHPYWGLLADQLWVQRSRGA